MKIFIDITPLRYKFSGIQNFTLNLIKEFKKSGEEVREIKKFFLNFLFEKGDIYLGPDGRVPFIKRVKIISTIIHDVCFETNSDSFPEKAIKRARKKMKKALLKSDIIFVPSNFTKKMIEKFYGLKEKVYTVYPGVSVPEKLKEVKKLPEKFFLFVGIIQKRKNTISLVRAFKELNFKDIYLVLAGEEGYGAEEIKKEIGGNVIWLKREFSQEEIFFLYKKSLALLFPTLCEGFGFPVLEAMISKTPCIASPLPVFKEFAGDDIFYFEGFDKKDIIKGIIKFLEEDEKKIERKISNAFKRAKNFTWGKTASRMLKIWKEVI